MPISSYLVFTFALLSKNCCSRSSYEFGICHGHIARKRVILGSGSKIYKNSRPIECLY